MSNPLASMQGFISNNMITHGYELNDDGRDTRWGSINFPATAWRTGTVSGEARSTFVHPSFPEKLRPCQVDAKNIHGRFAKFRSRMKWVAEPPFAIPSGLMTE